jgi:hypothetical protein
MSAKKTRPSKKISRGSKSSKKVEGPALPPYGIPIRDAIARGNRSEMRSLAARTRKYLSEIERALKVLEAKIAKHKG